MANTLTPEQEARAKQAFTERRFDPASYEKEIMGAPLSPAQQVAMAEATLAADAPALAPVQREAIDAETLAAQQQRNDEIAQQFAFLDPADYENQEETSTGRVMKPVELLARLTEQKPNGCGLNCWFAAASEAQIAKELNPRDVALAYRKIGQHAGNLMDMRRWNDAIAEIRQEEAKRQPMCNYERFGLWVVRGGGESAEYVTWIPGCWLREYALVKFDDYGVPDWFIPGWRDVLIALIRARLVSEETALRVFGEAMGPRSRRYKMILAGLRNQRELAESSQVQSVFTTETQRHGENQGKCAACGEIPADCQCFNETSATEQQTQACLECHHPFAHFMKCSQFEAWYNGLSTPQGSKEN